GSSIIAGYSNFGRPTELVRISTGASSQLASRSGTNPAVVSAQEIQLTHTIPDTFTEIKWIVPEIVQFKSRDGVIVPAMIYKPANFVPDRKYPVVVFVHGAGYLQNIYRGVSYYSR